MRFLKGRFAMGFRNWIAVLALAAIVVPAGADDEAATAPTLLVRIKSIDGLMADARYVAALAGQEEQAKQVEKMLPAFLGPKGLAGTGIDTTKPIGVYGILDPQLPNSQVVVMIPVSDERTFVETLKTLSGLVPGSNVSIEKGKDGVYTITSQAPVEGFLTIADGYAYVTALRKDSIASGTRLSATKLLPADDRTLIGVTVRLDAIDDNLKQIALGQMENQMAAAKEKKSPNETPAQTKLREQLIDHFARQVKSLFTDGRAVEANVMLDRKTDDISAQLSVTAKPGSPLAKQIAGQSAKSSRFGPLDRAAAQGALNVAVPDDLRAALTAALDDSFKQAQEHEKDLTKRAHAKKAYEAIAPTLKAGQLDLMVGLGGPNAEGKYTLFGGLKVQDAAKIERTVKELVPEIPDAKAKSAITLDAETIRGTKVHKVVPPDEDAEAKRIFGEKSPVMVAFPTDAVVVTFGADAAGVMKTLLEGSGTAGGPFKAEGSLSQLVGLEPMNGASAKKVAADVFGADPKGDLIRVSVEGGPALRFQASMKCLVIKFGVKMDEAAKGRASP
jgi:hypothetical protein